ncbi:helix-turn-helix domain-containing protein [Flavobacterium sp. CFBP9031]|jgi:transcriptional regulator with XRE-family HTH domain|uniref:helix-turn-helix domain-containing protein n=1 Tax=unclassified Flavobacterium TaxID=196869 RepID=UPI002A6A58A2|nr:helix-turn-helix domain-containing protein [Flavobacterium sp. CFBP9031]MDY0987151.1 helix-turn-helix domain-containing protein [Flavobacterium sp. CFBP9031]
MKNKVKFLREEKNMTQNELAEKSGLSLRTIQRIEAGNILKGFTLKTIAEALETNPENLIIKKENIQIERAKLINLSVLSGLIIPFGSVVLPLILTYKTQDSLNNEIGKQIVSLQIVLSLILSVLMIVSPFIQHLFTFKFPLFIIPLIAFLSIKFLIVILNGVSLNQKQELAIKLKNKFL